MEDYKITKQEVIENYQDDLLFLKSLGHKNNELNIKEMVNYNGLPKYLQHLYHIDFDNFSRKILNDNCYTPHFAYQSLIECKGDVIKAMEIVLPEQYAVYKHIKEKGFSDQSKILEAMYFNGTPYNNVEDSITYLNRKEIYKNENKIIKEKYGLNNDDVNFAQLFISKGNIDDAVFNIDETKILKQIKKNLDDLGLNKIYKSIDDFDYIIKTDTKNTNETVAYLKIYQKGEEIIKEIDELLNSDMANYSKKLELLEKYNWDTYLAAIANNPKHLEIYTKYKSKYNPMYIYYFCQGLEDDYSKCDQLFMTAISTLETVKQYGITNEDKELLTYIFINKNDALEIIKLFNPDEAQNFINKYFTSRGYTKDEISQSYEFVPLDIELNIREELIKIVRENKLDVLSQIRESIGESNLELKCGEVINACRRNNFDYYGAMYDLDEFPKEYKGKLPTKELYEKFVSFKEGWLDYENPNFELLAKNNFDVSKTLSMYQEDMNNKNVDD